VTTQRLSLEEIFSDQPGSTSGGSRPPRRRRRRWGEAAERAGLRWAVVVWVLVLAALIAAGPGRMTFDTKLGVDIDPVGFYRQLWPLWDPLEVFGGLQDQYIGYAFPMGAFYLIAHLLHVPVWLAERAWMSLLITLAFWGLVRLAEALGIGSRPTRFLAGAAFALWPTFTILIGSTSAAVLPGALAPWAVLPLTRSGSARMATARSGLVVACMGGVNAVSTLAAIVPAGLYILTRPGRRRWVLAAWWTPAILLATSWWLGPLLYQGRYGFNFLPYIEQAANTTQTMSAAAALRGSGNWVAYLNFGQPWLTAGSVMVTSAWAVAAGAVAAAAGLAGLARRDLPEAGWLRGTAAVAALWALTGYAGPLGGPLHQQVQALLDGPLSALRNVFKIEPALALVLALGIAHVLARGVWPLPAARRIACAAVVVVLAGMGLPYLTGKVLQPGSFSQVPGYWQQAATWLAANHQTETTLVVPADSHGIYTWGQPIDEPLEPLARSP
jgi:arabinofuranan 3-O-arabinosyltransferase